MSLILLMVAITYKYQIFRLLIFRLRIFNYKNTTLYTYIRHYVLCCTHIILLLQLIAHSFCILRRGSSLV